MLDCVAIASLGGASAAKAVMKSKNAEKIIAAALEDVYIDVSQNPCRRPFSNSQGIMKCLTTSTILYSFRRDGLVLPFELMLLQGHGLDTRIPASLSQRQLHDLAGMGICLPCMGIVFLSMMLTVGLRGGAAHFQLQFDIAAL